MGAGTLLQLEWNFIMPANTLAIFAAKAPVELSAPNQEKFGDDGTGFKDYMDTAVHKTDTAQKPSKEDSPQNQNDNKTEKTKTKKRSSKKKYNMGSISPQKSNLGIMSPHHPAWRDDWPAGQDE